jgi:hypothetical protein
VVRTKRDAFNLASNKTGEVRPEHEAEVIPEAHKHRHVRMRHLQLTMCHNAAHDEQAHDIKACTELGIQIMQHYVHCRLPTLFKDL